MIHHYHGSPIWGCAGEVQRLAVRGAGSFVSYARPDQLEASFKFAEKVAIDNGAFSSWRRGLAIDWGRFYDWLDGHYHRDNLEFFVIPDVVDGGEEDNDRLISELPRRFYEKAAPVWHLHESIDRLVELCREWPRVCFGSSGQYATIRTAAWHQRMRDAFEVIYGELDFKTKIHGLRMLDGRILGRYPLDTADSTNLACNVPKFNVKYPDITKGVMESDLSGLSVDEVKRLVLLSRCAILKNAIESVTPPSIGEYLKGA